MRFISFLRPFFLKIVINDLFGEQVLFSTHCHSLTFIYHTRIRIIIILHIQITNTTGSKKPCPYEKPKSTSVFPLSTPECPYTQPPFTLPFPLCPCTHPLCATLSPGHPQYALFYLLNRAVKDHTGDFRGMYRENSGLQGMTGAYSGT